MFGGSSPGAVRWRVPARVCRAHPPPYNLLLTVRGIATLQFVHCVLRTDVICIAFARIFAAIDASGAGMGTSGSVIAKPVATNDKNFYVRWPSI